MRVFTLEILKALTRYDIEACYANSPAMASLEEISHMKYFLSDSFMEVIFKGQFSEAQKINAGIPQGPHWSYSHSVY